MNTDFVHELKYLRERMRRDENTWGIIPDSDNFINPKNEKLVEKVFGPYVDDCAYIFNILIMDMDQDPGDFAEENDITSAKQFVDDLLPVIKNMGYNA